MERQRPPPTYLNYRNVSLPDSNLPRPPSSPSRPPPAPPPPAGVQSFANALLIYINDTPPPDMQVYLATIFSRYTMSEVSIIATNDEVLKLVRMDVYTAAGKMRQDIVVSTSRINAPLSSAELQRATQGLEDKTLCGVLCCQHSDAPSQDPAVARDILDYEEAELEVSWRTNLMTLHSLARATVPLLRRAPLKPPPFFCLDSTIPLSPLDAVAQDALLHQLATSPASQGLRFGSAKEELIPAPPNPLALNISNSNLNGSASGDGAYYGGDGQDQYDMSPMSESPTKLWASWAMMNE